jgi:hypothetical protein
MRIMTLSKMINKKCPVLGHYNHLLQKIAKKLFQNYLYEKVSFRKKNM